MSELTRQRARATVLVLGAILALTTSFALGRHQDRDPAVADASRASANLAIERVDTTNPRTGQTAPPRRDSDRERAEYVPTTRADATPEQRARAEIEIAVRGFLRGWGLRGSIDERQAALEPFVSTPTMLRAFALTDPDNVPAGGLADPPVIGAVAADSATVFAMFRDSSSITIHVVRLDAGWRVYQVDQA